ncbi:D-alanyl-D-alanine carboxypeptidase family protein [Candidatus Saccharibacteria bacterium]|nr:D-alanyl-D-alanine carboxypeptidase family protein [Candidatus Saccharibacteria bacterium]
MRILEPKQLKTERPKRKHGVSKIVPITIVLALLIGLGVYVYALRYVTSAPVVNNETIDEDTPPVDDPFSIVQKPLKQLSGDGFKDLYLAVAYPNTQEIVDPPPITGNSGADARIRAAAEARGYRLSRIPMGAIVKLENEPRLDGDDLLQALAANAWYKLKDAARRDGFPISLISAYRSPQYQRDLFTQRLFDRGVTAEQLASGAGDSAINAVLEITAVPGFSRHHTGYTVDFWCEDGSTSFLGSSCYKWISADGYRKAMEFGWIPSYPEGASEQGPEPEPWEYVWVGDAVRQQ